MDNDNITSVMIRHQLRGSETFTGTINAACYHEYSMVAYNAYSYMTQPSDDLLAMKCFKGMKFKYLQARYIT